VFFEKGIFLRRAGVMLTPVAFIVLKLAILNKALGEGNGSGIEGNTHGKAGWWTLPLRVLTGWVPSVQLLPCSRYFV
jgi:hypothetical protein